MKEISYMTKKQLLEKLEQVGDDDKIYYVKLGIKTEMFTNVWTISGEDRIPYVSRDPKKYKLVNNLV